MSPALLEIYPFRRLATLATSWFGFQCAMHCACPSQAGSCTTLSPTAASWFLPPVDVRDLAPHHICLRVFAVSILFLGSLNYFPWCDYV
jgi:hypothetical protein